MTQPPEVSDDEMDQFEQPRGVPCSVGLALARMDERQVQVFEKGLANPNRTASAITGWLKSLGFRVEPLAVRRHRRGDCNCAKRA